ncbi:hypothetical protein HYT58_02260 [Candidatus Woesearchaeota archaeon]|nr:hypothetical protein [Candidatus Woesearchaeota archaeon]
MFLKEKAAFQIFVLIIAIFTVSNLKEINAQTQVCCEKATSGEYCLYTDPSNCASGFNTAPTTCDQTQFCKPSCAVDTDSGACFKSVPLAKIRSTPNMTAKIDATCNSIAECNKGCCKIGSQFRLATEKECNNEKKLKGIPEQQDIFDEAITSELTCANEAKKSQKGCCITEEGLCKSTLVDQCSTAAATNPNGRVGWFGGTFCSDSRLNCGVCKAKTKKGCVEGQEDVFWFDSCGNQEDVADDCDYGKGTLCKKRGENDAYCASINCEKTEDFKDKNTHDPRIGEYRQNGESWCIYESGTGGYMDRPGSRHFRHMCINGEELVEPCRDFREEICTQSNDTSYGFGTCLKNEIYNSSIKQSTSTVPQGFKFWENEGEDKCAKASSTCKVIYVRPDRFSDWECKENCICETQEYIDHEAFQCKSKGDCGADINILSKRGSAPSSVNPMKWDKYGVFGGMKALSAATGEVNPNPEEPDEGAIFGIFNERIAKMAAVLAAVALVVLFAGGGPYALLFAVPAVILLIVSAIFGGAEIAIKIVDR